MSTSVVPTQQGAHTDPGAAGRASDGRREGTSPTDSVAVAAPGRPSEGRAGGQPQSAQPFLGADLSDRAVDADLLIDIPQLAVEELSLELDASLVLNRVKLDAKGLEAGLYLKADFDHLEALTRGTTDAAEAPAARGRKGLRDLIGGSSAGQPAPSERGRHSVAQGLKAGAVTAAGLAGAALLEARTRRSRKLPVPWRRNRARAFLDEIAKRLP